MYNIVLSLSVFSSSVFSFLSNDFRRYLLCRLCFFDVCPTDLGLVSSSTCFSRRCVLLRVGFTPVDPAHPCLKVLSLIVNFCLHFDFYFDFAASISLVFCNLLPSVLVYHNYSTYGSPYFVVLFAVCYPCWLTLSEVFACFPPISVSVLP